MIRLLFGVVVAIIVLVMTFFSINSRAENQNQPPIEQSPEQSQIEQLKQEIEAIQRQNQQQIEELQKKIQQLETQNKETQEKTQELGKKAESLLSSESWFNNVEAGYDQGTFIKTKDGNWTLRFWDLIQPLLFFDDNRGSKTVSFQILRERFIFSGNAVFPWLQYRLHFAADKGSGVTAKDIFINVARFKDASLRIGQFDVPFNRERIIFDPYNEFWDRSIVSSQFDLERDIGAMVYGRASLNGMLDYGVGVFNGAGPNVAQNPNGTNLLYAGRLVLFPFGKFNEQDKYFNMYNTYDYTQGDPIGLTTPLLAIGVGFAGLPHFNPNTEATTSRANLANTILAINPKAQSADVFQNTADLTFKYYGFAFEAEYHLERIFGIVSNVPAANTPKTEQGLRLQAGYFLVPHYLETAFRYAIVDKYCQNNIKKVGCQTEQEFTPGLNYYIHGYNVRIALDYSLLLQDNPAGGHLKDNRIFIEPQLWF